MPVHRSAAKRIRQSKKRRIKNRSVKSALKTKIKKFNKFIATQKIDKAREILPDLLSQCDKAASQGIIHKNTASRQKSRLTKRVNKAMSHKG